MERRSSLRGRARRWPAAGSDSWLGRWQHQGLAFGLLDCCLEQRQRGNFNLHQQIRQEELSLHSIAHLNSSLMSAAVTTHQKEEDEAAVVLALRLTTTLGIMNALKTSLELGLLEVLTGAGSVGLTPAEVASRLPVAPANPEAPAVLDRIMRYLTCYSVLTCAADETGGGGRRYALAPAGRYLARNGDGASMGPLILMNLDPLLYNCWDKLKYAVLDGVIPFVKVYGVNAYEYFDSDPKFNKVFNEGMSNSATLILEMILNVYQGFEGVNEIVDVGGGTGSTLNIILSKYPSIKGKSFDLPHVISDAPPQNGIELVAGDMFESIPSGEVILLKWVLHNWSDEHCVKILKNCRKALPDTGKVIVMESVLPEIPENNDEDQITTFVDLSMLLLFFGAKERTENEFKALAMGAGFSEFKAVCCAASNWVMEFNK